MIPLRIFKRPRWVAWRSCCRDAGVVAERLVASVTVWERSGNDLEDNGSKGGGEK